MSGERMQQPWIRTRLESPHDRQDWVDEHVFIRRNSDGLVRLYASKGLLEDDDSTLATYIWEEGNFSCDCNRYGFFQLAAQEPESPDYTCGSGGYTVWIVNPANGETVYDERSP